MSTLDNILADTRQKIDGLRAESAEEAREATAIAERMAEPTDAYRAMEAEERDLLLKLGALRDEMRTAASALAAMKAERDLHQRRADFAANVAEHIETKTLPDYARILDGAELAPAEAIPPGPRLQDNGLPMVWSDLCAPGGYVCAVYETAGGPGLDMPNGTRICGNPVESEPCDRHGHPDDVPPSPRALPVATPPVPTAPAGELVATSGPLTTMPDPGSAHPVPNPPMPSGSSAWPDPVPAPLPPAEPAGPGKARHEKPKGSRWTGGLKLPHLGRDEHTTDEQDGDDRG